MTWIMQANQLSLELPQLSLELPQLQISPGVVNPDLGIAMPCTTA